MRLAPKRPPIFSDAPFSGQGISLYLNGLYRKLRLIPHRPWLRHGDDLPIGGMNGVTKTARIGSQSGSAGNIVDVTANLSTYLSSTVTVDVRHYKDNVEREAVHPIQLTLDGSGDGVNEILGAYSLIATEIRAGGIVRVRFQFIPATNGIQPSTFTLSRTAGPTSPSDIEIDYEAGVVIYEINTGALSDSSAYTFDLIAENGATSRTLDSITFTADATGPGAPTSLTVEAY